MRLRYYLIISVLAAILVPPGTYASADEPSPMVRLTCLAEANFFEIETFGLYNIPDFSNPPGTSTTIYKLGDFVAAAPFTCQIAPGTLQVDVVYHHPPIGTGECGGNHWASFSVKLDGREIIRVEDSHGGCPLSYGHRIRATQSQLTHCVAEFESFEGTLHGPGSKPVPMKCRRFALPYR